MKYRVGTICILFAGFAAATIVYSSFRDTAVVTDNTFTTASAVPSIVVSVMPSSTPTVAASITPFSLSPTATQLSPGDIVINEVNWAGNNEVSIDEWIELRNMTDHVIALGGWSIENLGSGSLPGSTLTIPQGKSIAAGDYFLISHFDASGSKLNVFPDWITSSISLANAGEQLRLKSDTGVTIDVAGPPTGAWPAGSSALPRKSMERKIVPGDGSLPAGWQTAVTHTGMDGSSAGDEYGTPRNPNGL